MIKPKKLNRGDMIGVIAPFGPIVGKKIEELERAREIVDSPSP